MIILGRVKASIYRVNLFSYKGFSYANFHMKSNVNHLKSYMLIHISMSINSDIQKRKIAIVNYRTLQCTIVASKVEYIICPHIWHHKYGLYSRTSSIFCQRLFGNFDAL